MPETAITSPLRATAAVLFVLFACGEPASAQFGQQPPGYIQPPGASGRNPVCLRYESQLAAIDRGPSDPTKLAELKRYEDAAAKLQAELDQLNQQAHRHGCQGRGFFALFSNQSPQCGPINDKITQIRTNLDRLMAQQQDLQGNSADREGQRRAILVALGQNDCGPQYRRYANTGPTGFFDSLFGGVMTGPDVPLAGTYRTLCVRTCDGYYFPISYSTVPGKFADDEQLCRRLCPAAEAVLFSHRNPGEDINRAVAASGQSYTQLPTAFAYRKQYDPTCSCRAPGQSWANALKQFDDQTIERGDIVVQTEEQAKALSQPRLDAQGKPIRPGPAPKGGASTNAPAPKNTAAAPVEEPVVEQDPSKRKVRSVGPVFIPAR